MVEEEEEEEEDVEEEAWDFSREVTLAGDDGGLLAIDGLLLGGGLVVCSADAVGG